MASFLEDFTRDIPRGLSSRYLKQQTAPQARWQTPEVILERKALEYDPRNPGGKILIGAFGNKLVGIEDKVRRSTRSAGKLSQETPVSFSSSVTTILRRWNMYRGGWEKPGSRLPVKAKSGRNRRKPVYRGAIPAWNCMTCSRRTKSAVISRAAIG